MDYSIFLVEENSSGADFSGSAKPDAHATRLVFARQKRTFAFERETVAELVAAIPASRQTSPLAIALKRYLSRDSASDSQDVRNLFELDGLWANGDKKTRCKLLENKDFLWMLNERQAEDICHDPDMEALKSLYKGMNAIGNGILPPSPRLSTATRIKLIKLAMVAHAPSFGDRSDLENLVRERISIDAAERIFTSEFPLRSELEALEECFIPAGRAWGSALNLAQCPLESAMYGIVRNDVWNKNSILATYAMQLRHGKWEKLALGIGTDEFELGLADIALICDYCDLENSDPEFIDSLFQIGHPEITKRIIWSGMLTRAQEDEAWDWGNIEVCEKLLDSPTFLDNITDSQAEDIMAVNDPLLLQSLATKINYLYKEWDNLPDRRLSINARDKLLRF